MSSIIIDRRKNPQGKSLNNRQRFIERAKKAIEDAAKRKIAGRSINDTGGADISISSDGIGEPQFQHDRGFGEYDYVLPGNQDYVPGDTIAKPRGGDGMGKGGNSLGEGEDDFEFALSYDEYLNVIFDGLELPDLVKATQKKVVLSQPARAGHTNSGIPSNLNIERTAIAGISRRIALKAPKLKQIAELEAERVQLQARIDGIERDWSEAESEHVLQELQAEHEDEHARLAARVVEIKAEISSLRLRANAVGFLDDVDMRFNNFIRRPKPSAQAVMFCLMDVSGSMGQREKTIAKKFFLLLSLFLRRQYKDIDVVFIRHHEQAFESTEEEFFNAKQTGGTVVSTAYECMNDVIRARYPVDDWNIYMAQVSDGDNAGEDNAVVVSLLSKLLPKVQHFNYIEVTRPTMQSFFGALGYGGEFGGLWQALQALRPTHDNMDMAQITDDSKVIDVFREMFKKDQK